MANQTPNRLGQINQAGAVDALFQDIIQGEIMTAYEEKNVTDGFFMERTVVNGKGAEFHLMGNVSAFYHVPGEEILGGQVNHGKRLIGIDAKLVAPLFIDDLDEAMAAHDYRAPLTRKAGEALAVINDRQRLQVAVLAARSTADIPDLPGGSAITEDVAGDMDDGAKLFDALEEASAIMDENDIPADGRYCFLPPRRYNKLARLDDLVDRDVALGNGNKPELKVSVAAGFKLIKTNHLPTTNITTGLMAGGDRAAYVGDYTKVRGLCVAMEAIGTAKAIGLRSFPTWDSRRLGWDFKTWQAIGHGVLRPDAAIELRGL
jgi:hypothetical protein